MDTARVTEATTYIHDRCHCVVTDGAVTEIELPYQSAHFFLPGRRLAVEESKPGIHV
jgi:hypothetical protein